ncbi:hypothetical protein [Thiomicrospira microaerophila]|uniref:hypothetical protein n=1 Tax=Thiomicrospira microaerophila TaxID=406020 RepID=UPI000698F0BC|nr:hypothetical protein [Thiomicrospira microaerophila]
MMNKKILVAAALSSFVSLASLVSAPVWAASHSPALTVQVESVVMGTDGQMRVRINGQYLTRHSEKDGVKVIDMDYQTVKVEVRGQQMILKPHQTLTLEQHETPAR